MVFKKVYLNSDVPVPYRYLPYLYCIAVILTIFGAICCIEEQPFEYFYGNGVYFVSYLA
jgi:hypothetical protein